MEITHGDNSDLWLHACADADICTLSLSFLFLLALTVGTSLKWWLAQRQIAHVQKHQNNVPEAFREKTSGMFHFPINTFSCQSGWSTCERQKKCKLLFSRHERCQISAEKHAKVAAYTLAKTGFEQKLLLFEAALLLLWTFGGLLNAVDQAWRGLGWSPLWTGAAFLMSITFLSAILKLPVSFYRTCILETRFGFNQMTTKVFIADLLKSAALSLVIGVPLIMAVLWLMGSLGNLWWLWAWLVWMSFSIFMVWAYSAFIAPLFNRFKPLEEGSGLRDRIEKLLQRNGFSSSGVFVMDDSRRPRLNAYFTGIGRNKRIILSDTLLKRLTVPEVEAIAAHFMGNIKHKHVQKRTTLMAAFSLGGLALLGWLIQHTWFYNGLGVEQASTHAALMLFMLCVPVFSVFFTPLIAHLSRKHIFQADDFAAAQTDVDTLIQALVKLYQGNFNTLTPDTLYSAFYDSYPPAQVRVAYLVKKLN
ncbi:MAG: M48 family metallopeptidase [Gammaproteobacteria bacterium]|nr:M48 family metallopeptidase [Gammaproteobacteria bacterium]